MARKSRLDAELVRRGLARSREHAAELIAAGAVRVGGRTATKSATAVDPAAPVVVKAVSDEPTYVSRGAHKLLGALAAFGPAEFGPAGLTVAGRRCLDAGASTGGFTDVLLREGAAEVVAVDVGYGQLAWSLRSDERVRTFDRQNVRALAPDMIDGRASLTVADLSFISLRLVLPALTDCTEPTGDLVPMVKPQFEVGRERLGAGGVVRDAGLRAEAVCQVAEFAATMGWGTRSVVASPLPGPAGNVEFFLWLRTDAPPPDREVVSSVVEAASVNQRSGREESQGARSEEPEQSEQSHREHGD